MAILMSRLSGQPKHGKIMMKKPSKSPRSSVSSDLFKASTMEPERTLRDCLEKRLDETGIILCLNDSEYVFFNHFRRKFNGTELVIMPTGSTYYTSESIAAIAKKNG